MTSTFIIEPAATPGEHHQEKHEGHPDNSRGTGHIALLFGPQCLLFFKRTLAD